MIKRICLIMALVATIGISSQAVDVSYYLGDTNGAKIGFNLFQSIQINAGIDYKKMKVSAQYTKTDSSWAYNGWSYIYTDTQSQINTGLEIGVLMPSIGAKILLPVSPSQRLKLYAGGDYFFLIPFANGKYKDTSEADAGQASEDDANKKLNDSIDDIETSGFNVYLESEYFFDDENKFGISGVYGLKFTNLSAKPTVEIGAISTYTQFGLNYHF